MPPRLLPQIKAGFQYFFEVFIGNCLTFFLRRLFEKENHAKDTFSAQTRCGGKTEEESVGSDFTAIPKQTQQHTSKKNTVFLETEDDEIKRKKKHLRPMIFLYFIRA